MLPYIAVMMMVTGIILNRDDKMWMRVRTDVVRFEESAKKLNNPNRGFYYIYDFSLSDEEINYQKIVENRFRQDLDTDLTLIQICLQEYRTGAISAAGLDNLDRLFQALEKTGKQLIVRFVYDIEGKNLLNEPQEIEIILGHMNQIGPILQEYSNHIFILQGLFVGNWGEMHGTRYSTRGSLRRLAMQLAAVTDESIYLAVRTPVQWRIITQNLGIENRKESSCYVYETVSEGGWHRLGLFNDGMLGNETDYGTYGTGEIQKAGIYDKWNRQEELCFQDKLCRKVPNGGEVIDPNSFNDIDCAIEDMSTMHITYLNGAYDGSVLEKWKESVVREQSCFNGIDGYTYVERHLGYRLFIDQADITYRFWEKKIRVNITFKNAGFAPLYREPEVELYLWNVVEQEESRYRVECELGELTGGRQAGHSMKMQFCIELGKMERGKYEVYLRITDPMTGRHIQLANEQEEEEHGYKLGEYVVN